MSNARHGQPKTHAGFFFKNILKGSDFTADFHFNKKGNIQLNSSHF